MEGEPSPLNGIHNLTRLIADLNPRRRHDLEARLRFLAATSEGWCEPVLLTIADIVAEQSQAEPSA